MAILWAVRHGETDWNRERRLQGHVDTPLNAVGLEQAAEAARRLAEELQGVRPVLVASDLRRARQTAEAVAAALGVPVRTARFLRERAFGQAEGRTWEELRGVIPEAVEAYRSRRDRDALPGSEPERRFQRRILRGTLALAQRLDERGRTGVLVTHGGVIHVLLEQALGANKRFVISNTALYRLEVREGQIRRLTGDD